MKHIFSRLISAVLFLLICAHYAWGATVSLTYEGTGSFPRNSSWTSGGTEGTENHTTSGSYCAAFSVNGTAYITYNSSLTNVSSISLWGERISNNTTHPSFAVEGSTDGGSSWTTLVAASTFTLAKNSWTEKVINISPAFTGMVRLKYSCTTTAIKFIDDITITYSGSTCTDPETPLSITNAATATVGNSLTLTTAGGNGSDVTWSIVSGGSYATLSGSTLNPTSAGTVRVQASQGVSGGKCGATITQDITISLAPIDVTLYYKGTSTTLNNQPNPCTLPTISPYVDNACEEWAWHCWTNAPYSPSSPTTTAPSSTVITSMSSAGTAYAVYKHEEAGGGPSNVTFNVGTDQGSRTSQGSDAVTKTGITISSTSAALGRDDEYRIYSGSTTTISTSTGKITSIVLNSTASGTSDYGPGKLSGTGYSYSGSVGTWIGNATSVTLSASAQFRATSIVVTTSGGGTTTYTSSPDCTPCLTKVTLTKGEESHGTFTLDKSNGEYNNCTSNFVVTVSGITPASGYYCTGVTATGDHNSVSGPDGSGNYTVTYEKENAITSIITANFAPNPKYTVIWSMNGDESSTAFYEEGEAIVFPGTATGCDGKVFRGWSAAPVAETDIEPSYVTSATMPAHDVTYYAVFAEASGSGGDAAWTETAITDLTGTDIFVIVGNTGSANYALPNNASGTPDVISVTISDGKITSTVANNLKWNISGNSTSGYTFYPNGSTTTWLYSNTTASSSSNTNIRIGSGARKVWSYTSGNQLVTDDEYTDRYLAVQGGSDFRGYTSSTTSATTFKFYAYSAGTTYSGYTTTCGAGINAPNIGWITATKGEKVKREIAVSATNFDDPTTLSVSCANSHFNVSLAATDVPAGAAGLATTLTVEYTPADFGAREENVDIVLTAGDKTRTIKVSGRSLPEDFLMIVKKNDKWYALPANMTGGPGEYAGIEVAPNDNTTPTVVPVSPSTAIYHLASNAADRYETAGQCVRLVGMGELCLWSNMAESTTKVNIQNKVSVSSASGVNYDWLLTTTDGIRYTIANPNHPHYSTGRRLAYGEKFGMYTEETEFFIVSAGCTSQPDNVLVSPHRVDATFSWMCTAPSVTIDIYTNEAMTEGHLSATVSSAPYMFTGLAETTDYWYRLTPGTDTDCAVTGSFKTTGPSIDIVEWQQEAVILHIDKGDITPVIVIDGQEEHGSITGGGGTATELFFAKYFEGAGSMKLLSIFNGTNDVITLSGYKFVDRHAGSGASSFGSDVEYDLTSLGSINAGQEIIFFTRPKSTEVELSGCSTDFLNSVATKDKPTDNPRWIECASGKFADKAIEFNGNDAILLKKNGTIIDIIGALNKPGKGSNCSGEDAWEGTIKNMDKGKSPSDPVFDAFYETSSKSPITKADSIALLAGFGINLSADEIDISTARCIFFRDKRVTSGDSAVLMNAGDNFVTFTNHGAFISEWYGRSVCMTTAMKTAAGVTNDAQATCNSYQDIANMDYNEYYIDYTSHIEEGKTLDEFTSDPETKEYRIPITDLAKYTCLNIRFQLKQGGNVITEVAQQVPIMVSGSKTTKDALFSELVVDQSTHLPSYSHSVERCKTCDVVVLGTGTLTKAADSDGKDVPEVGNIKVYPGGKLVVPSTTNYTVKSLAFRRQEDEVSTANIEGNLSIATDDAVYLDMRVDPTNWHYFALPYDCNVADIRFANPNETAIPTLGTDFLLKYYDGEKRAATQAGGCWEMVAPDATLKKGIGYIFALPGEGKEKQEFRFPMSNAVVTEEKASTKQANGIYAYGGNKSMTEVRANHRGWNLIGDPYLLPYTSDIEDPVMTGLIVEDHSEDNPQWNGHYKFDPDPSTNLRYIVEPVDNGWSEYKQVAITDYEMKPFTSYFVQIGGSDPEAIQGVQFKLSRVNRSSIVRRAPAEYEEKEDTHPVWCAVNITSPKGEKDETTMLISDDFTDGYDMMNDLVKMRGTYYQYAQITTKPVLASRNNEGEMAFNALPDASALAGIPLHYFSATQGEYVIAYDDRYDKDGEVKEVKLFDKTTNDWYDLMNESYPFFTQKTDNKDRFILSVRVERRKPSMPTDIDAADLNRSNAAPRKILINDHVYILRGGAIYDVTGKQMLNH